MKKLSSYQKMKIKYENQIKELTKDIVTLVENKDFEKATSVKLQWKIRLRI